MGAGIGIGEIEGVVDHGAGGRVDVHGSDPFVFGHIEVDGNVAIDVGAIGGDVESDGHFDDEIRFAQSPAGVKLGGLWLFGRVAFGRALFDPVLDEGNLVVGEAAIIEKREGGGSGFPRRHYATTGDLGDGGGFAGDVVVGKERERGGFARTVTGGTVLVNDWGDVVVESNGGTFGGEGHEQQD